MTTEMIHWVGVDEDLPDEDRTVLTCDRDGEVWLGYLDSGEWFVVNGIRAPDVIWWAEMPVGIPPAE